MAGHEGKFLPRPGPESAIWWENCRAHRLMIQRCSECGHYQFYPRVICSSCGGGQIEWRQAAGYGTVQTYSICRLPVAEAYAGDVPYVVALVQLEEGPVMMCNVIDCDPESVAIDMAVEVTFEDRSDEISLPQFRPQRAGDGR